VLSGLEETDQILATAVRKAIFTFANIPERVTPRDIPRILREVDADSLLIAMAGAEASGFGAARDFVLENMSGRMADQLREDMEEAGKIKPAQADEAMSAFVAAIRDMEGRGDLVLVIEEDDEEDS